MVDKAEQKMISVEPRSTDTDLNSRRRPRRRGRSRSVTRLKRAGAPARACRRIETPPSRCNMEDEGMNVAADEPEKCGSRHRRRSPDAVSARKLCAELWRLQMSNIPVCRDKADLSWFEFRNHAMEGSTKWDPVSLDQSDEAPPHESCHTNHLDQQSNVTPLIASLRAELEQARVEIKELEAERDSSKKKLVAFVKKLAEEQASWKSREHEKTRSHINDMKSELNYEKKSRHRLEMVNSQLISELSKAKGIGKQFMQAYEKERKGRELIEEVCDELAKEVGDDKAEVEAIRRESIKLHEEIDEERKMLQMAEVWREERVQMKLADAKIALQEKYSQMNKLVQDIEFFLTSPIITQSFDRTREAQSLIQEASSIDIDNIKEFTYEPPDPDEILTVLQSSGLHELNKREIDMNNNSFATHGKPGNSASEGIDEEDDDFEEEDDDDDDESGWETASHVEEDQGSSDTARSVSQRSVRGAENRTPMTDISEIYTIPVRQTKKMTSITRLWKSTPSNGDLKVMANGRKSNGSVESLEPDLVTPAPWSSPDSVNPRGMKGCIDWTCGAPKNSSKTKLSDTKMERSKLQLRQVLKHQQI